MFKSAGFLRNHFRLVLVKACFIAGLFSACSPTQQAEIQTISGFAIGTSYSVKMVTSLTEAQRLQMGIESVLADVNARMSTYVPRSDIALFGQLSEGQWLGVSPKTALVVNRALEIAELSGGYFDPTIAELVDLWGFGPTPRHDLRPSEEAIADALTRVGFQAVLVDSETNRLGKTEPRTLDLSGIAKGYAVDLIAEYLLSKNITNFLVEVGGDMRLHGLKPGEELWRIAIEDPAFIGRSVHAVIEVSDLAIVTSGDYRNFFELEGQRYSHTLNPNTGYPVDHDLASVTVVADNAMDADAWATAFTAMGTEKAMALANAMDIAAYFIVRSEGQFDNLASDAFSAMFSDQLKLSSRRN